MYFYHACNSSPDITDTVWDAVLQKVNFNKKKGRKV